VIDDILIYISNVDFTEKKKKKKKKEREREREYAIKFIIWWVLLKAVWNREIVISDESIRVRNHMDKLILTLLKMA